ncbi:MAG: ATPase, T2SS/T4P/T4SS family [Armatimonas sp.]
MTATLNSPDTETRPMYDGFERVDLETAKPTEEAISLVPGDVALKNQMLPLHLENGTLVVAIGSPLSLAAVDELGILLQRPTRAVLGDAAMVKEKIEEIFLEKILAGLPGQGEDVGGADLGDSTDLADLQKMAGETAVVQMVNLIFAQAVRDGASDIHIEPYEKEVKVRCRIDGILREMMTPPKRMHAAIISRLKILGELNIAERRLPQDGRIKIMIAGRAIDIRVSIVPTVFGERCVMRILDKGTAMLGLAELGINPDVLARVSQANLCALRSRARHRTYRCG